MSAHSKEKADRSGPFSRLMHLLVKWQLPWSHMSGQNGREVAVLQRPSTGDREAWRTEPEIDTKRRKYLAKRRLITPNIEQGIYPFKDVEPKLTRADIEWLLATHESEGIRGPVDWVDERQGEREGLDLRGAYLQEEDLTSLPLNRIRGGLTPDEWMGCSEEQRKMAVVHLQKADLSGASLNGADLSGADLFDADLFDADLNGANLQKAILLFANLQEADLILANLQQANLDRANLQKAQLLGANLQEANLSEADLRGANLFRANLQEANLSEANLQEARLSEANLQEANLRGAQLKGADLRGATLANEKQVGPKLADSQWSEVNLAVIKWSQVKILGDEYVARQKRYSDGVTKQGGIRLEVYEAAVRANRQLAVILRNQGLNEVADRFAYRAQVLQKSVLWFQVISRYQPVLHTWDEEDEEPPQRVPFRQRMQALGGLFFSWFLFLLAGYGYKPIRSVLAYLVIIFGFMGLYLLNSYFACPHLRWDEALVLSVSSFHGRGFFSQDITLGDTYARLASFEAVVGLFIEISFIATFTQRFFGK